MHRTNVACLPEASGFLKGLKEKSPRFCKSGDFKDILCMEPQLPCYVMSSAPPGFLRILPPQPLGASGTKVPATQMRVSSRNFNEGSFSGARMITIMVRVKTEVQFQNLPLSLTGCVNLASHVTFVIPQFLRLCKESDGDDDDSHSSKLLERAVVKIKQTNIQEAPGTRLGA